MPLAGAVRRARRSHAGSGIEDGCPDPFSLPLAVEPGQQQQLGVFHLPVQAFERVPRRLRGVGEDQAGRRLRGLRQQFARRFREEPGGVALLERANLQRLHGVQPPLDGGVRQVFLVEVEPLAGWVAGRCEGRDARARTELSEQGLRARCALGECIDQRPQVWGQMRFVQENQAVGSRHRGVYRTQRTRRPVAPEQEP